MYAVTRTVKTYDGYDECWSCSGQLSISYYGEHCHTVAFDGKDWFSEGSADEHTADYLRSAAVFAYALDECRSCAFPPEKIYEFIHQERDKLIPSELFRLLMDDCGLSIFDACQALVHTFGSLLSNQPERKWLYSVQPRTAHLESVLQEALLRFGFAFHNSYDTSYRSPLGAIEDNSTLTLRVHSFGGVKAASACIYGDDFETELIMQKVGNDFYCEFTPTSPAALWYKFRLNCPDGENWLCCENDGCSVLTHIPTEDFRLTVYKRGYTTPEWFRRSVMYQIFPDRFGVEHSDSVMQGIEYHKQLGRTPELHKSTDEPPRYLPREFEADYSPDDFYGGTLRGIAKKLPYLKELGIGTIYLNPIFEARSNHRYDTADYSKIDPVLGSNQDYVNLCAEAKKLGISIINDGVFSHTGADSVYFNRFGSYPSVGACQGESSEFYKWYDFTHFPDKYRSWWGFKDLPEVNELDCDWQNLIVSGKDSIIRRWLRSGSRGWRIDVADELPDEVLSMIRASAKAEKPDSVIIGEVWEDAVTKISYGKRRDYALGYSLDSVMNYPFRSAVIDFALGESSSFELRDFLLSQRANYPKPMYLALMNLLGSHDVERLHTVLALGKTVKFLDQEAQARLNLTPEQSAKAARLQKLCAALAYCIPGVPCLYYGDEECLDGGRDPFNRAPFEPRKLGLHNFYLKLGELRNTQASLIDGTMQIKTPSPDIIIILRDCESEKIACIINRSADCYDLPFENTEPLLSGYKGCVPAMSAEIYKFT